MSWLIDWRDRVQKWLREAAYWVTAFVLFVLSLVALALSDYDAFYEILERQ